MEIDYKILFSNRKTLNISVERDRSIVVRAPNNTSLEKIEQIIESKKLWLYEKINHKQKYNPKKLKKEFVSGESFLYLGKYYKLNIISSDQDYIGFKDKFILSNKYRNQAAKLFKYWFIEEAKDKIIPKVQLYAKSLGVNYNEIMISDLKYRWGSCTPKDNLNFNWRLIKAPMFVIKYVIVHELAHLFEGNHTPEFWNIVRVQIPYYEKAKEWLRENGELLEGDF